MLGVESQFMDDYPITDDRSVVTGLTRARLFGRVALLGGALLGGAVAVGGVPSPAASATSAGQDEQTLKYLLELEDLQAAFYEQALKEGKLEGEMREFARVVGGHEREHVAYLRKALGQGAAKSAAFDFGDATSDADKFLENAIALEETGLGAYTGAAVNLSAGTLRDAAKIVSVEARHTAWARDLAGENPAPRPTDKPSSEADVRAAVEKTGFVKSA